MPIRPSQLRNQYRNITVTLDAPQPPMQVCVTKYACQVRGYGVGQADRVAFKDRLLQASRADHLGLSAKRFVNACEGKGSIEEIQKILRLAARHRVYFHSGPQAGPLPGLSPTEGLRRVVDAYIGLDCNGFVGNWAVANSLPGASVDRVPLDWLRYGTLRQQTSEIRPFDLMIWANNSHIAVVEYTYAPLAGAGDCDLHVAESSTGGIQVNPYSLRQSRHLTTIRRDGRSFSSPFVASTRIHGNNNHVFILGPNGISG